MQRAARALARFTDLLLSALVAILVLIILGVVVSLLVDRYIVDVPFAAPDEIAKIAMIWLTFIGFSLAYRDGLTIRVDLLDHILPRPLQGALGVVFDCTTLGLVGLLMVKGWTLVNLGAGQTILGTPFTAAVPNAGFFAGMVLMSLFAARNLLRRMLS